MTARMASPISTARRLTVPPETRREEFSSTSRRPTKPPSTVGLMRLTAQAAIGAAITPPTSRPATGCHKDRNCGPSPKIKPTDAEIETRNSEALTVPITFRG